ncbi:MAG: hypothetical protein KAW12_19100 [Candidatus Aminicenantes bacterium]|nr:hypothetical protein [Candidatus Aminicenantes bacterium]
MGKNKTGSIYLGPKETHVVARLSYEKATIITREQLKELYPVLTIKEKSVFDIRDVLEKMNRLFELLP